MERLGLWVLCVALAGLAACGGESPTVDEHEPTTVPVVVDVPAALPTMEKVLSLGRLLAGSEVDLAFKVAGVVARIYVESGDVVEPGQVLAQLAAVEVDAQVLRAEEKLRMAARDLTRTRKLLGQGLVSQELFDNARANRDVAEADLQAAEFNRTYATIIASSAGRVLERLVEPGEMVAPGQPIVTVTEEAKQWQLRVSVPDRYALRLNSAGIVQVGFDALPKRVFPGRISRIGGRADPATGTFDVDIAIEQPDLELRSGMIGRAELAAFSMEEGVTVPVTALVQANGDEGRLFVVADGKAALRSVRLGRLVGTTIAVLEGLAITDSVIVAGGTFVDHGQPVRLVSR